MTESGSPACKEKPNCSSLFLFILTVWISKFTARPTAVPHISLKPFYIEAIRSQSM